MVADSHSRFTFLAADLLSAAQPSPTPLPKTRVGGFRRRPSGRLSRRGRRRPIITPGSRACGYKTVSGRHEWPNRDPIQEFGGLNLYGYVANNPINLIDPLGLSFMGRFENGLAGAAGGIVSGAATGTAAGAIVGGIAGEGVGAAPGAALGRGAGAIAGGIGGFAGGFLSGPDYNGPQAAQAGAINGGLAGLTGGAGAAGGVIWGAGTGAVVGGTSAGAATQWDPGAIATGTVLGGGFGGLGPYGEDFLNPFETGLFNADSELIGDDFNTFEQLWDFNNPPTSSPSKKGCP